MKYSAYTFLLQVLILASCIPSGKEKSKIFLAQGLMSGEPTATSIILQSRLTLTDTLTHGDIPGAAGMGRFEISDSENFENSQYSEWLKADSITDFILKYKFKDLRPETNYSYRLHYGNIKNDQLISSIASFKTNPGKANSSETSFVVVTGMNYYHFHYGKYNKAKAYASNDKNLGYPALKAILELNPDFFIGTGDNVYFDHPNEQNYQSNINKGNEPHPGGYEGKEVVNESGMRRKYHEQFSQQRFIDLFREIPTYWEKDDHDYRKNDADPFTLFPISHELGIKNFKEQLPIIDLKQDGKTYRTHRINKDLQLWFVEGRDYRDANSKEDGPDKSLWGKEQLKWLKSSLLESDATFKILITPTPMVGPDDAYKKDNHVNVQGFRHEGEAFFDWIVENDFLNKNFYIICGDRHWQYHARHPKGIEEFSTGALVDNNARAGRIAGDPKSTDPDAKIIQYYIQGKSEEASGGFLNVKLKAGNKPELHFLYFDENGSLLYSTIKKADN